MAIKKRKKRKTPFQKFLVVVISLICIEVLMLLYFSSSSGPKSINQAIEQSVSKRSFSNDRTREKTKIQLAVQTFFSQNNRFPEKMEELIPLFLDTLPVDPNTGQPFIYKLVGKKYYVYNSDYDPSNKTTGGVVTASAKTAEEQENIILASLRINPDEKPFVYDPTGRRDPFIPFDLIPKRKIDPNKSPLEQFDLSQLRLKAVILGLDNPKALVEDETGKGYYISIGTKIGPNNGIVEKIETDKLIVIEEIVKFTGEKEINKVEMKLNTSSNSAGESAGNSNTSTFNRGKK